MTEDQLNSTEPFVPAAFTLATQIVTNEQAPLGERIFIDRDGVVIARVRMTAGTSYRIVCDALLDAFTAAGTAIWDRDDGMSYHRAVRGRECAAVAWQLDRMDEGATVADALAALAGVEVAA